jgi:ATP-dependent RNA helicase DDX18/HAS1
LRSIIKLLPKEKRQTMMFSATQTQNVKDIAYDSNLPEPLWPTIHYTHSIHIVNVCPNSRLSLRGRPVYMGVDDKKEASTAEGLEQGYVVCPTQSRFLLLFTFLKKNLKKKVRLPHCSEPYARM